MTDYRLVLTTTGSQEEARTIARELIERRLAACVNIIPKVESIYRWEGAVEQAEECLLAVKTQNALFESLRDAIIELHSYEVPEVISLQIDDGSAGYLQWLSEATKSS